MPCHSCPTSCTVAVAADGESLHNKSPCFLPNLNQQRRTFAVSRGTSSAQGEQQGNTTHLLEQSWDLLNRCVIAGNRLQLNHVFGCLGASRFLINVKKKATGGLVEAFVKDSLGPFWSIVPLPTLWAGEKFVPSRNPKKRGTTAYEKRTGQATIEREAMHTFKDGCGKAIMLGSAGAIEFYRYSREGGLTWMPVSNADMVHRRRHTVRQEAGEEQRGEDASKYSTLSLQQALRGVEDGDRKSSQPIPVASRSAEQSRALTDADVATSVSMEHQRRTFLVFMQVPGQDRFNDLRVLEQDLKSLQRCEVTGKSLNINHVFGCVGSSSFLVNLKTKSTGRLVDSIVKNALGPFCRATAMGTQYLGEKFIPARNSRKRTRTKIGGATIERHAAKSFEKSKSGKAYLLGSNGELDKYSYCRTIGLVLDTGREDSTVVDVGCETGATASLEVERGAYSCEAGFGERLESGSSSVPSETVSPATAAPVDSSTRSRTSSSTSCMADSECAGTTEDTPHSSVVEVRHSGDLQAACDSLSDRNISSEASSTTANINGQAHRSLEAGDAGASVHHEEDKPHHSCLGGASVDASVSSGSESDDGTRPHKARRTEVFSSRAPRVRETADAAFGPVERGESGGNDHRSITGSPVVKGVFNVGKFEEGPRDVVPSSVFMSASAAELPSACGTQGHRGHKATCMVLCVEAGAIGERSVLSEIRIRGVPAAGPGHIECRVAHSRGFCNGGGVKGTCVQGSCSEPAAYTMRHTTAKRYQAHEYKDVATYGSQPMRNAFNVVGTTMQSLLQPLAAEEGLDTMLGTINGLSNDHHRHSSFNYIRSEESERKISAQGADSAIEISQPQLQQRNQPDEKPGWMNCQQAQTWERQESMMPTRPEERSYSAAEVAGLLRKRCSMRFVIWLLCTVKAEARNGTQDNEALSYDEVLQSKRMRDWITSLKKVFGLLGWRLEGPWDPREVVVVDPGPWTGSVHDESFLSWCGPADMLFQRSDRDFQECLGQIPVAWRRSLSIIVWSMKSLEAEWQNEVQPARQGKEVTAHPAHGSGLNLKRMMAPKGSDKIQDTRDLLEQASMTILGSYMRGLAVIDSNDKTCAEDTGITEDEAKEAALATLVLESMSRAAVPAEIHDGIQT